MTEELRERIAGVLREHYFPHQFPQYVITDKILALIKEAGYDRGRLAGIKEVVEFVKSNGYLTEDEWQAKLKEWGIE